MALFVDDRGRFVRNFRDYFKSLTVTVDTVDHESGEGLFAHFDDAKISNILQRFGAA